MKPGRELAIPMKAEILNPKSVRAAKRGYTLIELAVIIVVIGILATFALTSLQGSDETRDAAMVQSAQAALQSVVSQGSARQDKAPSSLDPNAVLNALKADFNSNGNNGAVQFSLSGNTFVMTIPGKSRSATFGIGTDGDVDLMSLSNFTDYTVQNGVIFKP